MYYVYLLQSLKTNEVYKGLTNNIDRRLNQHFDGLVKFTSRKLPIKLIHVEISQNRIEARKLEKFFKSGYGREVIKEIIEESE